MHLMCLNTKIKTDDSEKHTHISVEQHKISHGNLPGESKET